MSPTMADSMFEAWSKHTGGLRSRWGTKLPSVKRWDGASKTTAEWNPLGKDQELWSRNGECLVHLYEKGASRRGPCFRISLSSFYEASCVIILDRFADGVLPRSADELRSWKREQPDRTVDLYIPPHQGADQVQLVQHQLAVRNLFAWMRSRSLVGEHLGHAFVALLGTLTDLRPGANNMADLMGYMDEEGYLDFSGHPEYAIAVLWFAEHSQLEELYTRALAHCIAMRDRLSSCPEYQRVSPDTRSLIRQASADWQYRIYHATAMLTNFLDEDFSEANIGIPLASRNHLEKFRQFLVRFYHDSLGEYPPRTFESRTLRSMREDFQALYDLLVDDGWTADQEMSNGAIGGICTRQLLEEFEDKFGFARLRHPLPLLPQGTEQPASRRFSWFPGAERWKAGQRVPGMTALMKAANWNESTSNNELVRAYRSFEESTVLENYKSEKNERASLIDERKIRWILIYAVYQVLRSITRAPGEDEEFDTPYPLPTGLGNQVPWRSSTDPATGMEYQQLPDPALASPDVVWEGEGGANAQGKIEIKPDIDYLGITQRNRAQQLPVSDAATKSSEPTDKPLKRSKSFTRALSRSSTLRKSLRRLRPTTSFSSGQVSSPTVKSSTYHPIVVHGYGDGTHDVCSVPVAPTRPALDLSTSWLSRAESTTSQTRSNVDSVRYAQSNDEGMETPDTPLTFPSPTLDGMEGDNGEENKEPPETKPLPEEGQESQENQEKEAENISRTTSKRRRVVSMMAPPLRRASNPSIPKRRPISHIFQSKEYAEAWLELSKENHTVIPPRKGSLSSTPSSNNNNNNNNNTANQTERPNVGGFFGRTRSISVRPSSILTDFRRRSQMGGGDFADSQPAQATEELYTPTRPSEDWAAMQAFLCDDEGKMEKRAVPAWEQYAELGGLTEVR